ncbi:hypothetical protein [Tepidiforma sp.]|jgi:glutamyl-tRNA reductase|uniref:hypothetical protein n=1 Tax=Tepidiforma sp. TaxID=2682230 RepID=UPI002601D26C|nr:hypothetical protein [Tepidiforma sp.]MCX7616819.1 hypothetical protein [Tepidiforma sp.]
MPEPSWLPDLRVCAWRTVSLDALSMPALTRHAESAHPADALVQSCQRLEAYGFGPCACGAPLSLRGRAALERLAAVTAGLDSVVLGEEQIAGQVRTAFREARGPLRAAADLALAAARDARAEFPARSHAGHLLDRALALRGIAREGRLLVLGAGALGRLVARRGAELGFDVLVAGRRDPGQGFAFVPLAGAADVDADVVAGCLGSGAGAIDPRGFRPARLFIDLGTPRNFVDVPGVPVVTLADMLEDEARRPHAMALRARLRESVVAALERRLSAASEDSSHPIGRFRLAAEHARREALDRALARHPRADAAAVDRALRSAVNRLLHPLTAELRRSGNLSLADRLAAAFERPPAGNPAHREPAPAGTAGTRR